jgi:hypothetical protein
MLLLSHKKGARMTTAAWRLTQSYPDSAKRSFKAGAALAAAGDDETAGHMFGVAAECAIKAALEQAGIQIDHASGFRHHLPVLRTAILRHGRTRHMRRLLFCLSASPSIFRGYLIDTRYAADASIGPARCNQWRTDAKSVFSASGIVI